jgi:hypothetical protein
MTDLLNRDWFANDGGFGVRFPGVRKEPVAGEVRKANHADAAEASRGRAGAARTSQPGKPA